MKTKFLIPVLAAIFAIGMSFTNVNKSGNQSTDYIRVNGVFQPLNSELNCGTGVQICKVKFGKNGQEHEVYDDADISTLKRGNGEVIIM